MWVPEKPHLPRLLQTEYTEETREILGETKSGFSITRTTQEKMHTNCKAFLGAKFIQWKLFSEQ